MVEVSGSRKRSVVDYSSSDGDSEISKNLSRLFPARSPLGHLIPFVRLVFLLVHSDVCLVPFSFHHGSLRHLG